MSTFIPALKRGAVSSSEDWEKETSIRLLRETHSPDLHEGQMHKQDITGAHVSAMFLAALPRTDGELLGQKLRRRATKLTIPVSPLMHLSGGSGTCLMSAYGTKQTCSMR